MDRIRKTDKRVLGGLEEKADYLVKADFDIRSEELLGEGEEFQGLEKMTEKVPNPGKQEMRR